MSEQHLPRRTRTFLRALAHDLEPLVTVGSGGLTQAVVDAIDVVLERHELVKIKLGGGFVGDRHIAATQLATASEAALVQLIGRVVVLYRRRRQDDDKRPRIDLPA